MYVDAYFDRDKNTVLVSEVHNGKTILQEFKPELFFYIEDPKGRYESVFGDKLTRVEHRKYSSFLADLKKHRSQGKHTYEGNVRPLFKTLEKHFKNQKKDKIKITFWDIETNWSKEKGFAPPEDPFNEVTAISLYNSWENTLYSLSIRPAGMTMEQAELELEGIENNIICDDEIQMLNIFFELTKETNVYTGWNCMPITNNVWAKDGIYKLANIPNALVDSNVVNRFPVTKKQKFGIKMLNGSEIFSSKDHKFYCYVINDADQFTDLQQRTERLTENTRKSFIDNNLYNMSRQGAIQHLAADFDLDKPYASTLYHLHKKEHLGGTIDGMITKPPKSSGSPKLKRCSVEEIQQLIVDGKSVFINKFVNQNKNKDVDLYTDSQLYLAGLIYTDGSIRKGKSPTKWYGYSIYQSDIEFMETVKSKFNIANVISGPHKNNYRLQINHSVLGKDAHALIYTGDFQKNLNIENLSKLSKRQFMIFLSGLLDGDGYVISEANTIGWCNFNNDIPTLNELCDWNGIETTYGGGNCLQFPTLSSEKLSVLKVSRFSKLDNTNKDPYGAFVRKTSKSKAKTIKSRHIDGDMYRVGIKEIVEYDEYVDMMDIETDTHKFVCSSFETSNCESFDVPYVVNRVSRLMGKEATKNFCLWNKFPVKRMFEKYGKEQETYDFIGKISLDMLNLYRKYTYMEQASYRLDYIGELEIGENKVPYTGTLDQLYNNDYRKFIEYSRQDTMMLYKMNKKLDHINLAFTIAHENLVDIKTVMGAVALSDNAIVLEAHRRNLITRDKVRSESSDSRIAGAWVADPRTGIQERVSIVDLTSLYPSIFRTMNLGNETIVAQIKHTKTAPLIEERMGGDPEKFAQAWAGIFWVLEVDDVFNKTDDVLTLQIEGGEEIDLPAKEIYDFVFDNGFILTANGTIIRTDKQSIISSLLERWFNERIMFQQRAKTYAKLVDGITLPDDILSKLS